MQHGSLLRFSWWLVPVLFMAFTVANLDLIVSAIKKGDSNALAVHFDNLVELSAGDQEGTYSKAQAEQILKNFFQKYPPKSFQLVHEGPSSGNASSYAIGKYISGSETFRTSIYLRKKGEKMLIQEISFKHE